jgi:hypothetical protein
MIGPLRAKFKKGHPVSLTGASLVSSAAPDLAATSINVRASAYLIASSRRRCWKCSGETVLYALAVEPPFERRDGPEQWGPGSKLAVLSYAQNLPEWIIAHLKQIAPRYFLDESQWHLRPYWMNHCEHCGAKIGDYETIDSGIAPFNFGIFGSPDVTVLYVPELNRPGFPGGCLV